MAYFPDGSTYTYGVRIHGLVPWVGTHVLNAGWLDGAHPVRTGEPPPGFADRLAWLCVHDTRERTRGIHSCELCPRDDAGFRSVLLDGEKHLLGTAEIRVRTPRHTYAAPNLILHYVVDHRYLPPDDFVAAVMGAPESARLEGWSMHRGPYW